MNNYFGFQNAPLNYGTQTPTQGIFTGQQMQPGQMQMNPMMGMAAMNLMNQANPGQRMGIGQNLMSAALPLAMMAKQGGLMGMGNQGMSAAPQTPMPSSPLNVPGAFGFGSEPKSSMMLGGGQMNPSMFMGA
ncbi:hypothetical protein [Ralstonia sp. Ralssp135]|uniref:hypothetical protein n=1 Tax=Ralstonia sp. Ralssp135 TaxID=3243016 RepID=UPI0039B01F60